VLRRVSGNLRDGAPTVRCRARRVRARVRKTERISRSVRVPVFFLLSCVRACVVRVYAFSSSPDATEIRHWSVHRADSRSAGDRACTETPNNDHDDDDNDDDREVSALKFSQFRGTATNLCASSYHICDAKIPPHLFLFFFLLLFLSLLSFLVREKDSV